MSNRTYTITVTERQAAELQEACELLARIKIGQIDHAIERLPGFYDRRDWEQVHATRHEIQRLANALTTTSASTPRTFHA